MGIRAYARSMACTNARLSGGRAPYGSRAVWDRGRNWVALASCYFFFIGGILRANQSLMTFHELNSVSRFPFDWMHAHGRRVITAWPPYV